MSYLGGFCQMTAAICGQLEYERYKFFLHYSISIQAHRNSFLPHSQFVVFYICLVSNETALQMRRIRIFEKDGLFQRSVCDRQARGGSDYSHFEFCPSNESNIF